MKKQFLLGLMAMLLPLGAWADDFVVKTTSWRYKGEDIEPQVYAQDGSTLLRVNTDYTVSYTYGTDEESVDAVHDAGSYQMTIKPTANGEYSTYDQATISLTVQKVDLLVQPSEMHKMYGQDDSEVEIKYYATGFVGNDYKEIVKIDGMTLVRKETGEDVGAYNVALGVLTATATNYNIQSNTNAQLIIEPATLTVKFDGLTWTYGETEEMLANVKVTGTNYAYDKDNDENVVLAWEFVDPQNTKENLHDAGSYAIKATIKSNNYTVNTEEHIVIAPAKLYVSVQSLNKTYGEKDPAFETQDVTGYAYEEDKTTVKVTLTRTDDSENVGEYKIDGCEVNSENYEVVYEENDYAILTINAKSLADEDIKIEVAANDMVYQGKTFGLENITVTYGKKELADLSEPALTTDYTFAITPNVKNAGEKVTVTVTAVADGNYKDSQTYDFTIAQAPLTIKVADKSIEYKAGTSALDQVKADKAPEITIAEGELKGDDATTGLDGFGFEFSLSKEAEAGNVNFEGYEKAIIVTPTNSDFAANYDITYQYGKLTVTSQATVITIGRHTENTAQLLAAYNGYKTFNDDNKGNFTVQIQENRTLKKDYWYTMVLPFDITVRDFSSVIGYAIVNVPNEENGDAGKVAFKLHVGTIPANTLFLFKIDEERNLQQKPLKFKLQGSSGVIGDGKVVINYNPNFYVEDNAHNKYYGVYETTKLQDDNLWFLSGGTFYNAGAYYRESGTPVTVYALGGYVDATAGATARIYVEDVDGSTTAISAVSTDTVDAAEGWYTIGGVKLESQPTQKGIYINNGKKVIIK